MSMNTILDDIQTYSVLNFLQKQNLHLQSKEMEVGSLQCVLEINWSHYSSVLYFLFPLDLFVALPQGLLLIKKPVRWGLNKYLGVS